MNKIFSKILIFSIIFIASDAATKTEQYANNDGIEIFYVDYGPTDNEPILLVQGLGGQLTFWPDELIELLEKSDSFTYTEILIQNYFDRAIKSLERFSDTDVRKHLFALCEYITKRKM